MRHLIVTDSEIIESVGFNISSEDDPFGTLQVVFKGKSDEVYCYDGVPVKNFLRLVNADSIGKAFHELFRQTKYPFTKGTRSPTLKK